jgi:hypothetical protein
MNNYFLKYLKYKQKYNNLKGGAKEYCLYLTLQDDAIPGEHWGGIHITIIGRGNTLQQLLSINPNFNQTPNAASPSTWTLSRNSGLQICSLGGVQSLCFNSNTLDTLADTLNAQHLKNIKGKKYGKSPWHVAFSGDIQSFLKYLSDNTAYWHLTLCTIHNGDEHNCTWQRLDTLQPVPPPQPIPPPQPVPQQLRIGFDFDGVIHTSVGNANAQGTRNPFDPMIPFSYIIAKIIKLHNQGHKIFIITARSRRRPIIQFLRMNHIDENIIPDNNIFAIGNIISKVDRAMQENLDIFYDDSPRNINDFIQRRPEIQRIKPNFRLYQTFPNPGFDTGTIRRIY